MNIFILGPAGCGKSSLTGTFGRFLQGCGYNVKFLNLDPGCLSLPYRCDYDIRSLFTIEEVMRDEGLGPSGAMLRAMERLGGVEIPSYEGDFILIDTPGQLEVFVFHKSGPKIMGQFIDVVGLFVIDASVGVEGLPALYLYSLVTGFRLGISIINVVNKVDLLETQDIERFRMYLSDPASLKGRLGVEGVLSDVYYPLSDLLQRVVPSQRTPFVSAKDGRGLNELLDILHESKCVCGDLT
ncbi:MAG: ATP/GTP-binding protein [Candidatus Bathyarchaeia archaeon]